MSAVYLYTPPMQRLTYRMPGSVGLLFGIRTSTVVYRIDGAWSNVAVVGIDDPVDADVDTDAASGLHLLFTRPMVVPEWLHDELAAIQPADPSWSAGTLTLL